MMTPKEQRKEIKRLTRALSEKDRALRREKRENAALKRELAALKNSLASDLNADFKTSGKPYKSQLEKERHELITTGTVNARRFSKKSYLRYLIQSVKESGIGLFFSRIARFWRRLRLARTITAVVAAVIAALLVSAVFITILPFLLIFSLVVLLAAAFRARIANRMMTERLTGKRVRVIVMPDSVTFRDDTFAERSAKAMSREPNTAVLVVSPYFMSPRGLGGRGMFFTVREEAEDLYLVRRCYYFLLRRRVLDAMCGEVTVMY